MPRHTEFIRNVLTLVTGTVVAQAIPVLISPILTRLYTPGEFGVFALFTSMGLVLAVAAGGRYELAVLHPAEDRDAAALTLLVLIVALATSVVTALGVALWGNALADLVKQPSLAPWLWLLPLFVLATASWQGLTFWFTRRKQYRLLATNRAGQGGVTGAVNLAAGFYGSGAGGLVAGGTVGQAAAAGVLALRLFRDERALLGSIDRGTLRRVAVRYREFPLYSTWSAFLNSAAHQTPVFLLAMFFPDAVVGYFALTFRVLSLPLTVLGMSVGQVYFQQAAEARDDEDHLRSMTVSLFRRLLVLGAVPLMFLGVFGGPVFALVFGEEWREAGEYARVLSPWMLVAFIMSPLANILNVLERQRESFVFNVVLFTSRVAVLVVGGMLLGDASETLAIYGITGVVVVGGFLIYLLRLVGVPWYRTVGECTVVMAGLGGLFTLVRLVMEFLAG